MVFFLFVFFLLQISLSAQGFICAIGGGSEDYGDWSDEPYSWVVQKSDSGKIIIIADYDATDWIPNYLKSFGASEAYNIKIDSRDLADSQSVYDDLITAKAIFIKGGDQWDYTRLWKDTKVEDAIYYVFQHGGVIAGTSAGAAVLGDLDFSAKYGSVDSRESLQNPFASTVSLEDDFLDLVPNTIFDSHFVERGRFGRLISMLLKAKINSQESALGAGIDDRTAVCIDTNGIGKIMGSGAVSFFYEDNKTNFVNDQDGYIIENLKCDQLTSGFYFDFNNREIFDVSQSSKQINQATDFDYPKTNIWLTGGFDSDDDLNNSLLDFLSEENIESSSKIVLLTNGSYPKKENIENFLSSNNYDYSVIDVSSSSVNSDSVSAEAADADCFILGTDSLSVLNLLSDTTFALSKIFYKKIKEKIPVFFIGNSGKLAGSNFIDNTDINDLASWQGRMTNNPGLSIFSDLIFQPFIFNNSDFYENRTSALIWGLMLNRERLGIYLDAGGTIEINSETKTISGNGGTPHIIVDALETNLIDSSKYTSSSGISTRQIAGMNNLYFSLTSKNNVSYSLEQRKFNDITSIGEEESQGSLNEDFKLENNYPNPFNPNTIISWQLAVNSHVSLRIYDVLGKQIKTLINEKQTAGDYQIKFDGSNLPSGIYFYTLSTPIFSKTKPMVLLK